MQSPVIPREEAPKARKRPPPRGEESMNLTATMIPNNIAEIAIAAVGILEMCRCHFISEQYVKQTDGVPRIILRRTINNVHSQVV